AVNFPTAYIAQNQNQNDTSNYSDYGNCYTPTLDATIRHTENVRLTENVRHTENFRHTENVRHTENLGTNSGDTRGEYNELTNQSTAKGGHRVNEDTHSTHPNSHRHDVEQLHARREQNRVSECLW
ncbi:unnamed protein product, partial [Lymnaea stagnalis]